MTWGFLKLTRVISGWFLRLSTRIENFSYSQFVLALFSDRMWWSEIVRMGVSFRCSMAGSADMLSLGAGDSPWFIIGSSGSGIGPCHLCSSGLVLNSFCGTIWCGLVVSFRGDMWTGLGGQVIVICRAPVMEILFLEVSVSLRLQKPARGIIKLICVS